MCFSKLTLYWNTSKKCFKDGELDINSVVKYYFITARDNKNYKNTLWIQYGCM